MLKGKQIDIVQRSVMKPRARFVVPPSPADEGSDEEEEEDSDDEVDRSLVRPPVSLSFFLCSD